MVAPTDGPDPRRIVTRNDFGRELSLAKEQADVSVRDIARAVGAPASTVGGYLSGRHLPALRPADQLAKILGACHISDEAAVELWRQALRRARRATGEQASPASPVDVPPPAGPPAGRPSGPPVAAGPRAPSVLVSIRPPMDRLAQRPAVRGRGAMLDAFGERLQELKDRGAGRRAPVVVLHGLGGSGKSTLALLVARRAVERGIRVWWVSGAEPESIAAGMQALAAELGADPDQMRMGSSPDLVWRLLEEYRAPWLLVVDNADDPPGTLALPSSAVTDGTGWVRSTHGDIGLVLVTTRDGGARSWGDPVPPWLELMPTPALGVEDGALVLAELAGERAGSPDEARALARRLGGLPLALSLAGRHIAEAGGIPPALAGADEARTFAAYQQALDQGRPVRLGPADSMGRTWELSLDLLAARRMPLARPLLRLLSCLGPSPVACGLMLRPDILSESPLFGPISGRALWENLRALAGLGIVDLSRVESSDDDLADLVAPHPLVRDASRQSADVREGIERYLALVTALVAAVATELDPKNPHTWARWRALIDHSHSPLDLAVEFAVSPRAVPAGVLTAATLAARFLRATGQLVRAEAAYARVARLGAVAFGGDDPRVLEIQHDLGRVLYDLGRLHAAIRGLRAVLRARSGTLGPTHPDTLTTQHYLARTLRDAGQLDAAWRLFRKTLDARRSVLGDEHPDTLTSRNNAADALRALGQLDRAAEELRAVWDARVRILGAEHPATLVSNYNLARLAHDREQLTAAEHDLTSLAGTYERIMGPDHPRTLLTRQALVDVWHDLGQFDRAVRAGRDVLERRSRLLGATHPATLVTRHRLGLLLVDLGRPAEAEAELVAVLAARRMVLGPRHPDSVLVREALDALRSRSRAAQA